MKKTYIKPELDVQTIHLTNMLALSMYEDKYADSETEVLVREQQDKQREEWDIWAYPEEGLEEENGYYY